jgi:hypothetical protein
MENILFDKQYLYGLSGGSKDDIAFILQELGNSSDDTKKSLFTAYSNCSVVNLCRYCMLMPLAMLIQVLPGLQNQ